MSTGRVTTWAEREPELPEGGHHVIGDRRRAARRVGELNRQIDVELQTQRLGVSEDQRTNAGRRADDAQDEVLAIRALYPDMTLAESMWREHKGWAK